MRIRLNGKDETVEDGLSVAELLRRLEIHGETVAVEVNVDIIARARREGQVLKEGDEVEIVRMIGGGCA